MKKILFIAAMLFVSVAGFSQEEKTVVCVDKFENNSAASDIVCNNLRNEVMQGIMEKNRLNVVDIKSMSRIPTTQNEKLRFLLSKGIGYLITGKLNSVNSKLGDKYYSATVNFTLTITDANTALMVATETFKATYTIGSTKDEAILKAIEASKDKMDKFIDKNFKLSATIKALDQIDEKKGAVKTCYITLGSAEGIQVGQVLEVFIESEVAGETINKKIAEIRVKEVLSGTLSLCTVKSGGDLIKQNYEKGVTMSVVTRETRTLLDKVNSKLKI